MQMHLLSGLWALRRVILPHVQFRQRITGMLSVWMSYGMALLLLLMGGKRIRVVTTGNGVSKASTIFILKRGVLFNAALIEDRRPALLRDQWKIRRL